MANGDGKNNVDDILAEFSGQPDDNESATAMSSDMTGLSEIAPILIAAYQVYTAARLAAFSDMQAFQFARDYFTTMMKLSVESAG